MASLLFTDCFSSTTSRLSLIHPNRLNGTSLPRGCVDQLSLRTTASPRGRGCILSIRSSSYEIRTDVKKMKKSLGAVPGLAVVFVGDSYFSESYEVTCMLVQMKSFEVRLAEDSSEEEVLKSISRLNDDPCVHGIIVPPRLLLSDPNAPEGFRIVGDICYEEVCKVASAITPFEGGPGFLTITMLLSNSNDEEEYVCGRKQQGNPLTWIRSLHGSKSLAMGLAVTIATLPSLLGMQWSQLDELAADTAASMSCNHPDYATLAVSNLHKTPKTHYLRLMKTASTYAQSQNAARLDSEIIYDRDF
ncbi:unnamed protein product [Arabis nemorensis]|uniref:methylenetetrahydrofolate dehydrogenase (NADP(+)) n=1 Tax=Arabis nemorensis TaxID=586526 RepID=A0A565BG40_9BRAS|nr:unnamed protein product [Arabis nemorensis]